MTQNTDDNGLKINWGKQIGGIITPNPFVHLDMPEALYNKLKQQALYGASIIQKLKSPEMVDLVAELQANGWEYGAHPKDKAQIVINTILEELER